jgi:hypothetical protein
VVNNTGRPRRTFIFSKLTVVSSFKEWSVFKVSVGQSFPSVDSFSPGFTFFSAGGMAHISEWSRFNNQGHAFPREISFSPGFTLFSAGGMARIGNGLGLEFGTIILPCLRRIVQITHH